MNIYKAQRNTLGEHKRSDWIRLVFAHPFPLNCRAPIASANFIHAHDGACPADGGSAIQDQWVGTIQSFSSLTLSNFNRVTGKLGRRILPILIC